VRFKHLDHLLKGINYVKPIVVEKFPIFFFLICLFFISYLVFGRKKTLLSKQKIIFIFTLFLLTFFMSTITITNYWKGHLFILIPYVQILISRAY